MAYTPTVWVNDETAADEDNMNHIERGIRDSYNISLLAVSTSSPSECDEGDKYYNTITKKIYVATGTNTWPSEGTTPLKDILYILFSNNTAYAWNGENLVSVGGGGSANVNNSTITIKKNNVTVDSFTTNASSDKDINISVPEKISDLTDDSSFITISQGSNSNGRWIKFSEGTMICTKVVEGTANISQAWGNSYTTGGNNTIELGNWPQEFIDVPYNVQLTPMRGTGNTNYFLGASDGVTKSYAGRTSLLRFSSQNNNTYKIYVLAIGRWKQ